MMIFTESSNVGVTAENKAECFGLICVISNHPRYKLTIQPLHTMSPSEDGSANLAGIPIHFFKGLQKNNSHSIAVTHVYNLHTFNSTQINIQSR